MRARCRNPAHPNYARYGGRGIAVCSRWQVFQNFLEDMGEPPQGLTLERRDNDLGYSKDNCCWATQEDQKSNTSTTKLLTYQGKTQHQAAWARETGLGRRLGWRLRAGWPLERALTTPGGV